MKNRYGLDRKIPNPVARHIRKECGFGCVVCGNAIYEYEHIDPVFSNAKSHDPERIALLCGSCHAKVTKGIWSKDKVKAARQKPYCITHGESELHLDCTGKEVSVEILDCAFINANTILKVYGKKLLGVNDPDEDGGPPLLYAQFYDRNGNRIAKLQDNVWWGDSSAFDIETTGNRIVVRSQLHKIDLAISIFPPDKMKIDRMRLYYKGVTVECTNDKLSAFGISTGLTICKGVANSVSRNRIGISVDDSGIKLGSDKRIGPKFLGRYIPSTTNIVGCHLEIMKSCDLPNGIPMPPDSTSNDLSFKMTRPDGKYFYFGGSEIRETD